MQAIKPKCLIPIIPENTWVTDYVVLIENHIIVDIFHQDEKPIPDHADIIELSDHALLPGFVNTHCHSPLVLSRGLGDDLPLMTWLNEHIWPLEKAHLGPDYMREGSLLAMAEMIKSGTTCFNEHYFLPKESAKIIDEVGMRAQIGLWCGSLSTPEGENVQDQLNTGYQTLESHAHLSPLIHFSVAPHSPYLLEDGDLTALQKFSEQHALNIHMHVHEVKDEIESSLQKYGKRPLARLADHHLLSEQFLGVHLTQITDEDISIIKNSGMQVAHCPHSNLKLASGFSPIQKMLEAGINVSLGTDSAASNNSLDMLSEMNTAAMLGKAVSHNSTATPAHQALSMATINGAKAMGLADKIGSIEVGKQADIIAIDLNHVNTLPMYNPINQIVYAASRDQISHVWVAGKTLLTDHQLTTIDEDQVRQMAHKWEHMITPPI